MKYLFRSVAFLFIAILFSNCQEELHVEEESTIANVVAGVNSNIKRDKLKRRSNGLYKSLKTVVDPTGAVATMEVEMMPTNDILPSPNVFYPELVNEQEGKKKFKFNALNFENGEAEDWPFRQLITLRDSNGEPIGEPIESWATAQDDDEVELLSISLKQRGPMADYKVRTKLRVADTSYAETVTIYFTELTDDGYLEKDKSEGFSPTSRRVVTDRVDDDDIFDDWLIFYDEAETIETKINPNTGNVGIVVEVKNEAGLIMDDGLFVVNLQNTGPDEITIRNTKHRIKANGDHRITVRYEQIGKSDAELTMLTIPNGNADGSDRVVEAARVDGEFPTFVGTTGPIESLQPGDTYIGTVVSLTGTGEVLSELEAEFTVTSNIPQDPVRSIFDGLLAGEDDSFTYRTAYQWDLGGDGIFDDAAGPDRVYIALDPADGGSETETEFVELFLVAQENTRSIYEGEVGFIEPDNVVDMEYNLVMTRMVYLDEEREGPSGSIVVGQEEPFSIVSTCMSNGAGSDLFDYAIETNEVAFQNTDVLYVSFTNGSGESLAAEPSYQLFRTGEADGFVTFQGESLSFLDLNNQDVGATINFSLEPDFTNGKSILFDTSENIQFIGFYNGETEKWECEDECLSESNSGEYCGETDHF